MLADSAEATVRARRPASIEELEKIVAESIQSRLLSGQLDDSPLTMTDLATIRRAFTDVLRGLHHPRVAYPGQPKPADDAPAAAPAIVVQTDPGTAAGPSDIEDEANNVIADSGNGAESAF